ncbi:MAG: hypothetical protein ABIQ95_04555 [Bdellovibrionia bacterium]
MFGFRPYHTSLGYSRTGKEVIHTGSCSTSDASSDATRRLKSRCAGNQGAINRELGSQGAQIGEIKLALA